MKMKTWQMNEISRLDYEDKKKISYFANILLRKSKYKKMKNEITQARREITDGETVSHDAIWDSLNV
jgi:hypothetical protein